MNGFRIVSIIFAVASAVLWFVMMLWSAVDSFPEVTAGETRLTRLNQTAAIIAIAFGVLAWPK